MAQAVQRGQVTPADELRDLLTTAENRVVNVRGSGEGALTLLKELDRIAELWPVLEAQGADLRPEAGRWDSLQATVQARAAQIVSALQARGSLTALRREVHPEGTDAPWWRLDDTLARNRRRQLRRSVFVGAGVLIAVVAVYFVLKSLTDPKVMEASRRMTTGEQAVQQRNDWPAALAEFQAAAAVTPNDSDAWLRVGIADQQLQNEAGARDAFGRARALLPSDLEFLKARASAYFVFNLLDQADKDIRDALAIKNDDAQAWYMLASVYEARNQIAEAVDALQKSSTYAEGSSQDQLVALARYRMGLLMQRESLPQQPSPTPTP